MKESEEIEDPTPVPTATSKTDEELRETFKGVEKETNVSKGDKEKSKNGEEEVRFFL